MGANPKSVLMVFPLVPWPARANGYSIRYYPVLERLSRRLEIDLFVHNSGPCAESHDPVVSALRRVVIQKSNLRPPALVDRFFTVTEVLSPFGRPYQFARYHAEHVYRQLVDFVAGRKYDSVLWVGCDHREVLARLKPQLHGARLVYDSIDSPYLHYSREPRPGGLMRLWRDFDLWKTRRWENRLLSGVDAAAYISTPDATAALNGRSTRALVIPNGIYLAGDEVSSVAQSSAAALGFLGNMGYAQNVKGAMRLHEGIFMPLRQEFGDLRLMIIGRSPVAEVRALAEPAVEVTGTVESIWPYIARVSVFVFPMVGGAGLQNKILEAMHAGKPVVTTEICLKSIGAREGDEILIGRTEEELRAHVRALLRDPAYAKELGLRGKAYVDRTFDISRVLGQFERFLLPDAVA